MRDILMMAVITRWSAKRPATSCFIERPLSEMFLVQTAIETGEEIEKAVPETIASMEKG
jgi:hypothetical protein